MTLGQGISSLRWVVAAIIGTLASFLAAAASPEVSAPPGMRELQRANEALQQGDLSTARRGLNRVLTDAWSRDDLLLGGRTGYSLGAYHASIDKPHEAERWLVDAHRALQSAKASTVDVALLRARLAADLGQFERAEYLVRSSCAEPSPCDDLIDPSGRDSGDECFQSACRRSCMECLPCVGKCVERKRAAEECEASFRVKRLLTTAHVRLVAGDVAAAAGYSCAAGERLIQVCDAGLWADHFDVAGRIALARNEWARAACHFDRELRYLKIAGQYLSMADVLKRSAAAHRNNGNWPAAADRLNRLARVHAARGCYADAWRHTTDAGELARESHSEGLMISIALTAEYIRDALTPPSNSQADGCTGAMIEESRPASSYGLGTQTPLVAVDAEHRGHTQHRIHGEHGGHAAINTLPPAHEDESPTDDRRTLSEMLDQVEFRYGGR